MTNKYPFIINKNFRSDLVDKWHIDFVNATPFNHIVIDNFLPDEHAHFLSNNFPDPKHPVWLNWKKRSPYQFGKQGPGGSENFNLLYPDFRFALSEFNSSYFLSWNA